MATTSQPMQWAPPSAACRASAVVALAAMVGLFVLAVALILRDAGAVFFAFVFVFVAGFSGWFVLTRRRLKRWLGVVGLVVAFLGLLGFVQHQYLPLALLFATLAVFGFSARYAVRHDTETNPSRARGFRRTPRSTSKGVLIINPKSGDGKAERWELSDEAVKRGIEPVLLRPGDDLTELAELAIQDGADVIGMAGGDGSQAQVATIAMRHQVAHVCVPTGTRNHFALDLGLNRDDVVGALDAFTDGFERRVDLARVNEHVFVNNASLGLYAQVVQSDAYREAKLRTWRRALPTMLGPDKTETIDLRFDGPDGRAWTDAAMVVVSNNPYQVRRLGGIGSRFRMDGGSLGIVVTRIRRATDFARLLTFGAAGQYKRYGGLRQWTAPAFEVDSGAPIAVGLDGEAFMLAPPLRFVCLPAALRVRMPKHAKGVSPAGLAVSLTRRDFRRLVRIAGGKSRHARFQAV